MKVLLMVERNGRVVCAGSKGVSKCAHYIAKGVRARCDACCGTGYMIGERTRNRRWWLVEAESAGDARIIVAVALRDKTDHDPKPRVLLSLKGGRIAGRILARGGNEARP